MDPKRSSMDLIKFDTEPDFVAELEAERLRCEAQSAADSAEAAAKAEKAVAILQAEALQTTWGGSSHDPMPVRRKKTKAKALRRELELSNDSFSQQNDTARPSSAEDEGTKSIPIAVKQESLAIIEKMYPTRGSEGSSVRWQQFVHALIDAGFGATPTGGSAVSFSNDQGSISIHKPRPEPVVEAVILQGIGRRLTKWFDWSLERFEVRQKEAGSV